jgi:hypothetical protein
MRTARTKTPRFKPNQTAASNLSKHVSHVPGLEAITLWAEKEANRRWGDKSPLARIVIDAGSGMTVTVEMPKAARQPARQAT